MHAFACALAHNVTEVTALTRQVPALTKTYRRNGAPRSLCSVATAGRRRWRAPASTASTSKSERSSASRRRVHRCPPFLPDYSHLPTDVDICELHALLY
eukprot:6196974-Pleurochrysis_carterae.AAC.2